MAISLSARVTPAAERAPPPARLCRGPPPRLARARGHLAPPPAAIGAEVRDGGGGALAASLKAWVPYLPPKPLAHAQAQGGTFAFSGGVCVAARADRATADHLPPAKIREVGLGLVGR